MGIGKKVTFLKVNMSKPIIYNFFQNVTKHKKRAKRAVVFRRRLLPNILKYGDKFLPTILKTRFL